MYSSPTSTASTDTIIPKNYLHIVWILLISLTLLTAWLIRQIHEPWTIAVLVLTFIKGQLVVDHYMGLRSVGGWWRWLLTTYLLIVLIGIGISQIAAGD